MDIFLSGALLTAMQDSLGDCLDGATLQAMEVSRMMAAAGASQEEIEEMMAMILNKEGAVSPEFIASIKNHFCSLYKDYLDIVWLLTWLTSFNYLKLLHEQKIYWDVEKFYWGATVAASSCDRKCNCDNFQVITKLRIILK